MNIVSAMALLLEGHPVQREGWTNTKPPGLPGDYELDSWLMPSEAGIALHVHASVFGREQLRIKRALLTSEDLAASDWKEARQ